MSKSISGGLGSLNLTIQTLRILDGSFTTITAVDGTISGTLTVGNMTISGSFNIDNLTSTGTITSNNITSSGAITSNGSMILSLIEPTNTTTSHTVLLRDESNNRVYKVTDFRFSPVEDMLYTPKLNISSLPTIASQDVGFILMETNGDVKKANGSFDNATGRFTFPKITCTDLTANTIDAGILKESGVDINAKYLNKTSVASQTVASNVAFPNISVSGNLTGNVIGDLTGNSAGTHTGGVVGDTAGIHTGAVVGDTAGIHTGAVVGSVTGGTVTATTITTGNIVLTASQTIATPADANCIMTIANNSTNRLERTSTNDCSFQKSSGIFKVPKLIIKYFQTTQTNDYLPILQKNADSQVVSIDQTSAGVLEFGYSPGLNTLKVLNIGRDGKSFEMPNNTNDSSALGYALTISDVTTTPPQTAWAVVPSSSSFVTTDSTAQTILGTKTFNASPVFNNITGSTSNNQFTILTQNQGTFQMKHFVGDLSYNPSNQQLKCPRYFNQTLQLNYTTTYYCESYTVWDSSNTFGHDTYVKLSHNSGTGGNPKVIQHLQNIQNTATTPTTSAISFAQTASPTYWGLSSSDYEGVWYVSLACIYQNRLAGGSDRVVPRLDIRKYDGTSTWLEQPQISVATQYMRQDQGSLSTLRCQGPVYLNNNNLLRIYCNLEKGSIANPPTFNDSTNSWSGIDITISMRYLGTSTTTESETVTTL